MRFTLLLCAISLACGLQAEVVYRGAEANAVVPGAAVVRLKTFSTVPAYIKFRTESKIAVNDWQAWMEQRYFKQSDTDFELLSTETDKLGMVHFRYQQRLGGVLVENGRWNVHTLNGKVVSMNGDLFDAQPTGMAGLGEAEALEIALAEVGAQVYKWQLAAEENLLKTERNDPSATYYPAGSLRWVNADHTMRTADLRLCWRFDVYAHRPLSRTVMYVDATAGSVLLQNDRIHHADSNGVAITGYLGQRNIVANHTGSTFTLTESGRGDGIFTKNMNMGTSYGAATDFTDADNYWNNVNSQLDQYATDAHFGAEQTYDFFFDNFNRNSIDGNGFALYSYVHFDLVEAGYPNQSNAFWDGERMSYGDGNNAPFTALDIAGHEITHGLTTFTADLVYSYESGALNESFSDIFGAAVEFFSLGYTNGDWLMGEDLGFVIRSMVNPSAYGDPDTYEGTNWATGAGDNGGVHTNSGVQNFWFYLLTQGGSGTNDLGNAYSVTGLGIEDAQAIAYRNLTVYLTQSSQYADARFYALESAIDLFGVCSPQLASTGNAWYAVGIGAPYSTEVEAEFSADITESCTTPLTVNFADLSSNASSYFWDFGDGNTSTQVNPQHTYQVAGTYTVTLQVSSSCGADTTALANFVSLGPDVPCYVELAASGATATQEGCTGNLYDNGGPDGPYLAESESYITIAPCGASNVTITFDAFQLEGGSGCPYDYLDVYDGATTNATLIGRYCGAIQPPTTITSTGPAITLLMVADGGLEYSGFAISWECESSGAGPEAQFTAASSDCSPAVQFTDESTNCPDGWLWHFGDGSTSTDVNPTHIYPASGNYNVKLMVTNAFGADSLLQQSIVSLDLPDSPVGDNVDICPGESAALVATAAGEVSWYDGAQSTATIHVGDTFNTPLLNISTTYYAETSEEGIALSLGPVSNAFGGGGNFTFYQYLFFDVFAPSLLKSVRVYASGAGDREIVVYDADGALVHSAVVFVEDDEQVVDLNFEFEPGVDYQIGLDETSLVNLYRNNNGPSYPYSAAGLMSITRSSANQNPYGFYYYFYDWQVAPLCVSGRTPITASTSICTGVDELMSNSINLFPNPTSGGFEVSWEDELFTEMRLIDAAGLLVDRLTVVGSKAVYKPNLSPGFYTVVLSGAQASATKPLVVIR